MRLLFHWGLRVLYTSFSAFEEVRLIRKGKLLDSWIEVWIILFTEYLLDDAVADCISSFLVGDGICCLSRFSDKSACGLWLKLVAGNGPDLLHTDCVAMYCWGNSIGNPPHFQAFIELYRAYISEIHCSDHFYGSCECLVLWHFRSYTIAQCYLMRQKLFIIWGDQVDILVWVCYACKILYWFSLIGYILLVYCLVIIILFEDLLENVHILIKALLECVGKLTFLLGLSKFHMLQLRHVLFSFCWNNMCLCIMSPAKEWVCRDPGQTSRNICCMNGFISAIAGCF